MIELPGPFRSFFVLCFLLISAGNVHAEDHPIPDKFVYCTVCHGTLFKGNVATGAPRLMGLSKWYIARQLKSFSSGFRGRHRDDLAGVEMRPMAQILTIESRDEVSQLISELTDQNSAKHDAFPANESIGEIEKGRQLYRSCSVCHGEDGTGNSRLGAPNLEAQSDWYIARQMNNYRDKIRGIELGDEFGLQMSAAIESVKTDQDVADVVAYINSLQGN